jgi:iron complex transport system substrate-binding protein
MRRKYVLGIGAVFWLCSLVAAPVAAQGREITDMSGRRVEVPDRIRHIYAMTHSFPLITAIAPDLLAGVASPMPLKPEVLEFLPPGMARLPLLGGGGDANLEKLKASGIDVAFGWTTPSEQYPVKQLNRIGVPVVFIDVDRLAQYPGTFRFLGRLLHREARGELLAKTLEAISARVHDATAAIPASQRPRVYYAETIDGLTSQCDVSDRAEIIPLAGGRNALHCDKTAITADHYAIDLETLLAIDPDVIVTRFGKTAETIKTDARWQRLRAVRNNKVYAVPNLPFNWFDRPPSFMRVLGAEWLANKLHPDRYPADMREEARRFYRIFYDKELAEGDLDKLFSP